MKACHLSDTHDVYQDLSMLVEADTEIVFITGDLTYKGSNHELKVLLQQLRKLKAKVPHVVVIPGNHEVGCQKRERLWKYCFKRIGVHFLVHESITIEGINIFGTPWTPWFFGWAYQYYNPSYASQTVGEYLATGQEVWAAVPENTHVILSHGPPANVLDGCRNGHVGCPDLAARIRELPNVKYSLFGHVHEGYGTETIDGVLYSNASIMTGKYKFLNKPIYFDLEIT